MSWFLLTFAAILSWLWWDGMGAKEIAKVTCQRLCREHDVQFLDDTVALSRLRLRRDAGGNFRIYRRFGFEFTSDGELRSQGFVDMFGTHVIHTQMEPYRIH